MLDVTRKMLKADDASQLMACDLMLSDVKYSNKKMLEHITRGLLYANTLYPSTFP